MNVLWLCNIVFPEAQSLLLGNEPLKSSGGWMLGLSENLVRNESYKLSVVSISSQVSKLTKLRGSYITYYLMPSRGYSRYWNLINSEVCPDVIHIHGTESPLGLSYVDVCGSSKVCVSIQGLLSAYYPYYYSGLTLFQILTNFTLYSIIKGGILRERMSMKHNSKNEIKLLEKVSHIIGRTSWDFARTWAINPSSQYHYCGEILRDTFYDGSKWNYSKCDIHSIFISQASYPIKGLHQLIKALPIVLKHYPDTKVRIAGRNIVSCTNLRDLLRYSNYGKVINSMIKELHIPNGVIEFTGPLDADEMKCEYLHANVFLSPSTIENSPNSLAEAQILGVPCVASDVGGVIDMMEGDECNVYRFEEHELMASRICDIFSKGDITPRCIAIARKRHNRENVIDQLLTIYNQVAKC